MLDPLAGRLEQYMDLLSTRQKLVASNIANADTPGYKTKDIDAVIISTADFQHALHTIEAVKAGCDTYTEKPFAETMEDNRAALKAVRESKKIVQIGSQRVSSLVCKKAKEMVAQGMLGGLRVVLQRDDIALIHGPLAQAFLALVVTLVYLTSPAARTPLRVRAGGGLRRSALMAVAVTYAQIVLGALVTHAGWLWLHVGGAVAVFAVVPVVTARARRTGDAVARPLARALLGLLGLQLALGLGAYLARFSSIWIPGEQVTILVLPVVHRLVGGLLLAATVVLAVRLNAAPARDGVTLQREPGGLGGSPRTPQVNRWASPMATDDRPRKTAVEVGRGPSRESRL